MAQYAQKGNFLSLHRKKFLLETNVWKLHVEIISFYMISAL